MNCLRNTDLCRAAMAFALAGALGAAVCASAQQPPVEGLYQRADDAYNNSRMEDACDLFKQVASVNAAYKDTPSKLRIACTEAKRMHDFEEKWFKAGVDLFNQGRYDDAKEKFENANRIPLKHPNYRDQINQYLRNIEAKKAETEQAQRLRQECTRVYEEGTKLFDQGKYDEARDRFAQLIQKRCSQGGDAQNYLAKISEAQARNQSVKENARVLAEGVRLFSQGKYAEARAPFSRVVELRGPNADEARRYIQRIDEALARGGKGELAFNEGVRLYRVRDLHGAQDRFREVVRLGGNKAAEAESYLKQIESILAKMGSAPATVTPPPSAPGSDDLLRVGLRAYFSGNYAEAEASLTKYLTNKGSKRALAYFFRGATHSALFFLSAEKEREQKTQALSDFRSVQDQDASFRPPEETFVSPKILALYSQAAKSATQ